MIIEYSIIECSVIELRSRNVGRRGRFREESPVPIFSKCRIRHLRSNENAHRRRVDSGGKTKVDSRKDLDFVNSNMK